MEICSNLYRSLETLKVYKDLYKLIKLSINRASVLTIRRDDTEANLLDIGHSKGVALLEEKLRVVGLIDRISLCTGSPYQHMPVELRLIDDNGEDSIVCVLEEYPHCCGAAIASNFRVINHKMDKDYIVEFFINYIDIVYDVVGILGYSNVSLVISSRDNELIYSGIDLIKQKCADAHYTFRNKKTEALCTYIIKNV